MFAGQRFGRSRLGLDGCPIYLGLRRFRWLRRQTCANAPSGLRADDLARGAVVAKSLTWLDVPPSRNRPILLTGQAEEAWRQ